VNEYSTVSAVAAEALGNAARISAVQKAATAGADRANRVLEGGKCIRVWLLRVKR
jgi:hypothetical protein